MRTSILSPRALRACSSLGALFALAAALHADVLDVPRDHATIQEAVDAAADGDTILVTQPLGLGVGNFVTITGKGLTLVADGVSVRLLDLHVSDLPVSSTLVLRGIDIDAATGFNPLTAQGPAVTLEQCAGVVHLEDADIVGGRGLHASSGAPQPPGAGVRAVDSPRVVLVDCRVTGGRAAAYAPGSFHEPLDGAPGVHLIDSRAVVSGGELEGGRGGCGSVDDSANDGDGGPALLNQGGFASLSGVDVTGGDAGNCSFVGHGGDGVRQLGAGALLWLRDTSSAGGTGSAGGGDPLDLQAGGMTDFASAHRHASADSPARENAVSTLTFTGEPGDQVFLLASLGATFLPRAAYEGVLGAAPPYFLLLKPVGVVPGSGVRVLAAPLGDLGPGFSAADVHVQAVFADGALHLAAPTVLTLLDDAL